MRVMIVVGACFISIPLKTAICQRVGLPRFEDYPISGVYRGTARLPDFGDPAQYEGAALRCFGDAKQYSGARANFAGHFVIGTCTCGSGCHYIFVWDAITGRYYPQRPYGPINVGPYGEKAPFIKYRGEMYRVNSSLLIAEGCIEDTCDCATRYYNWTGSRFNLIRKEQSRLPPGCPK
jgi:hypothetical protein